MLINYFKRVFILFVGAKAQDHTMGLGPRTENSTASEEKAWVPKGAPSPILVGLEMFKRWSEEKCLLGCAKYGSNVHSDC